MDKLGLDNGFSGVSSDVFLSPFRAEHAPSTDQDDDSDAWPEFDPHRNEDDRKWDVFRVDEIEDDPLPEFGDFWTEDDDEGVFCLASTGHGGILDASALSLRVGFCKRPI